MMLLKKFLTVISVLLLVGSFLLVIATAGLSDFNGLAFELIAKRMVIALVMMVGGYGGLRLVNKE